MDKFYQAKGQNKHKIIAQTCFLIGTILLVGWLLLWNLGMTQLAFLFGAISGLLCLKISHYFNEKPIIQLFTHNNVLFYKNFHNKLLLKIDDLKMVSTNEIGITLVSNNYQVIIPFSEFPHVNLINLAETINQSLEKHIRLESLFQDENIEGFTVIHLSSPAWTERTWIERIFIIGFLIFVVLIVLTIS